MLSFRDAADLWAGDDEGLPCQRGRPSGGETPTGRPDPHNGHQCERAMYVV